MSGNKTRVAKIRQYSSSDSKKWHGRTLTTCDERIQKEEKRKRGARTRRKHWRERLPTKNRRRTSKLFHFSLSSISFLFFWKMVEATGIAPVSERFSIVSVTGFPPWLSNVTERRMTRLCRKSILSRLTADSLPILSWIVQDDKSRSVSVVSSSLFTEPQERNVA